MEEEFEDYEIFISSPTTNDEGDITLDCSENITIAEMVSLLELSKLKMEKYLVEKATLMGVDDSERIQVMFKEFTMKDFQDQLDTYGKNGI